MTVTYELMFILRPDLNQEQVNQQMRKYRDLLKQFGAEKVSMEVWGKRRLAYEINRFQDGVYILCYFTGDGTQVAPVERDMRLSEEVIRYLTTKHEKGLEFEEKDVPEAPEAVAPPTAPVTPPEAPESAEGEETTVEETTETVEEVKEEDSYSEEE